jgi:hypothetical protein
MKLVTALSLLTLVRAAWSASEVLPVTLTNDISHMEIAPEFVVGSLLVTFLTHSVTYACLFTSKPFVIYAHLCVNNYTIVTWPCGLK